MTGLTSLQFQKLKLLIHYQTFLNAVCFSRFDYYQGNNYIFSHLDGSYEKFLEKGFSKIEDRSYFPKKDFQELIRRRLFKTGHADKNSKFSDSVNVIKAGTREKEVELISKEIKELLIKKKVEPHKICVVFNLIQQYSPAVRDIFSLNGIPFNLTDRFALQTFYPVIEIIKLLEVLENDFYYKDVSSVLGGALFDKDEIDSYNLLQTAVKLKLVAGYENQIAKISDAKKSLERYKDGQDNSVKKAKLEKALADLKTLKKILTPFDKEMSPPEFLDNLKRLIYTRNLPAKILNGMEERKEENLKSIEELLETVDELCDLFALEYGEKKKFDLGFYLKNLRTAVKGVRFNTKEKSNYGVLVTNLNEIRGFNFEYIFIGGLTDGDLPTRYSPEIFFSGSFCKNDLRHITEERYHFYQSLCSWSKGLYLSYPEKEKKKELTKSSFLAEFQALFATGIITEEKFANKLYNVEEVLRMAGAAEFADAEDIYVSNLIDIKKIRNDIKFFSDRIINPFAEAVGNGYIYNGLADDEKEKLARLKNENYSITQLETYSLCPFRYYIDRVLALNEIEEPKEEIEAFELGSLIHSILYEYYKVTSARGIDAASQNKEESLEAEKILYDIAEKKIEDAGFYSPFSFYEKERILGLNGKKEESILYRFLEVERNRNVNFTPSYFEISFGKNRYEESSAINLKVEDVNVTGKIDRIDVDAGQKRYKIIDYKSGGKKPKEEELKEGLSLQLPLYMYAAKELLKEKTGGEFQPAAADIFSLKLGKDFGRSSILPAKQRGNYDAATDEQKTELIAFNEELIETCKRSIVNYVDAISKGAFNISKLKDRKNRACKYCAHSSICRVDEITEGKN